MNNILINVGVFTLSALGFALGSIFIGGTATNFDAENDNTCFVIAWAVGIIIYGITVSCMYGGGR
jgi:hypothetical protein